MFININDTTILDVSKIESISEVDGAVVVRTGHNLYPTELSIQAVIELIEFSKKQEVGVKPDIEKQIESINNIMKTMGTFAG